MQIIRNTMYEENIKGKPKIGWKMRTRILSRSQCSTLFSLLFPSTPTQSNSTKNDIIFLLNMNSTKKLISYETKQQYN